MAQGIRLSVPQQTVPVGELKLLGSSLFVSLLPTHPALEKRLENKRMDGWMDG